MSGCDVCTTPLEAAQRHIGDCREDVENGGKCWKPAEYVLWGKLIKPEGLGPRCYDHAAAHVGHRALARGSGWAIIHITDLVETILRAERQP